MLEPIAESVWGIRQPLRFGGLRLGARMTVVQLPDGTLWLHSPVPIDTEITGTLAKLGSVGHLVAPSLLHHMFIDGARQRYPDAALWYAPGLEGKHPQWAQAGVELADGVAPAAWGGEDIWRIHRVAGIPRMNEFAFLHRPSGTLLLTDLLFHYPEYVPHFWTRWYLRWAGALGKPGQSKLVKFMLKDKDAYRASVETITQWQIRRVVLCHGQIVEPCPPDELADALLRYV